MSPAAIKRNDLSLCAADVVVLGICLLVTALFLVTATAIGPLSYFVLVAPFLLVITVFAVAQVRPKQPPGLLAFVFFVALALDLSFRNRAAGETGLDWQNGLKLFAWSVMLSIGVCYRSRWRLVAHDPAVVCASAYCAFCVSSAFWSPVPSYTFACAVGGCAWFGLAYVCATRLNAAYVLMALAIALALECLIGLMAGFFLPDIGWLADYDTDGARLAGLSGHPNLLGQHAALLLIIGASAYEKRAVKRLWWRSMLILGVVTLLLTASRTAILAVLAAFVLVFLRDRRRIASIVLPLAAIAAGVTLLLKAADLLPSFDTLFASLSRSGNASEITTATNRSQLWQIAWGHFLERPLLGWGFNGTEQLMVDSVESSFAGNPVNAHNLLFQSLMSFGLIGSALVFGFLGILAGRFITRPDSFRDRLLVFSLALGLGEAELLSIPVIMSFLVFWSILRDAMNRMPAPHATKVAKVSGWTERRPSVLVWHWGQAGAGTKFTLDLAKALVRVGRTPSCISAGESTELACRAIDDAQVPLRTVPTPSFQQRSSIFALMRCCIGIITAFRRTIDEMAPDIALCTMQTIWDLGAVIAMRRYNIRYVIVLHDAWFRVGDTYPLRGWALRRQVAAADGLIVLSDHVGAVARTTFEFPASRMVTIPHGAFAFGGGEKVKPRHRVKGSPLRLLFVGRIVTYKGLDLLLDAFELLQSEGVNVMLDIRGSGDVATLGNRLASNPKIRLQNRWLTEEEIGEGLRDCDVVVLPYIEATQSGIAAAAFAAACPVIATPVGGLSEQVAHGKTGLIAAAVTHEAFAASIKRLCDDSTLYASLSRRALAHAQKDLSWDSVAERTCDFLDKIDALPSRRRGASKRATRLAMNDHNAETSA